MLDPNSLDMWWCDRRYEPGDNAVSLLTASSVISLIPSIFEALSLTLFADLYRRQSA